MEAIHMSTEEEMVKQNVVYIYCGILLILKKEEKFWHMQHMDKSWGYYAKWNEPVTHTNVLYYHIYML